MTQGEKPVAGLARRRDGRSTPHAPMTLTGRLVKCKKLARLLAMACGVARLLGGGASPKAQIAPTSRSGFTIPRASAKAAHPAPREDGMPNLEPVSKLVLC